MVVNRTLLSKDEIRAKLLEWLDKYTGLGDHMYLIDDYDRGVKLRIYTDEHEFGFNCNVTGYASGHSICQSLSPGEDWHRGSYLPDDGNFSEDRFVRFLIGCLTSELRPISETVLASRRGDDEPLLGPDKEWVAGSKRAREKFCQEDDSGE